MRNKNIKKDAGVIFIVLFMVLSTMVVTGTIEPQGAVLEVNTDKTMYMLGEPVTIFLTNVGDEILSAGGPIITIYNSMDEIVYEEGCYCWYELEPGEYETWPVWDQTNQQGEQVPVGSYVVEGFLSGYNENYVDDATFYISDDESSSPPNNPDTPMGPKTGDIGVAYTYCTSTIDPENDQVYFKWDWDDGTSSDWLGPYSSGESACESHTWTQVGVYCIKVKAKDSNGEEGGWSGELCVTISGGGKNPPKIPSKPSGPETGEPGMEYTYSTSTTDPDGHRVRYGWEYTQDNTVETWTNLYNSGAPCSIQLAFDDPGTYSLRVMAEDEYGAQSSFSPPLTIVITGEECVDFIDLTSCPIENAMLEIVEEGLKVSNLGREGNDGVNVDLMGYNSYECMFDDVLQSPESSIKAKFTGTYNGGLFWMSAAVGTAYPCSTDLGVHPVSFNGAATGAPSIIALPPFDSEDEHPIEIPVETLGCTGYITLGGGFIDESLGVHPVSFNGAATGAPSIIVKPKGNGDVVFWTWEEMDIINLEISGLMVVWKNHEISDGSLTDVSITATVENDYIIMAEQYAYENEPPFKPNLDGPNSGKAGTEYTYTINNIGTEDLCYCFDWGDGSPVEWTEFIAPGGTVTAKHTWTAEGTYTIKARAMNEYGSMSEWAERSVSMPKDKPYLPLGIIFAFGFDVDVKIVQLEPGEDYVDLEVLSKPFYIWGNEIITRNPGEFIRLYGARGLFSPSLPICFGICEDWDIIG